MYRLAVDADSTADLSARVIAVLKKRIDPHNARKLEWTAIGKDRFEVRLPPVPAGVQPARRAYLQARVDLLAGRTEPIDPLHLD